MSAAPVLVFSGLAWTPPGRGDPVFTGLELEVARGEVVALGADLGGAARGALRLAVGLERPSAGRVEVLGHPAGALRERVGYVSAQGALLSNLNLRDNLALPLRWLRDPPEAEVERRIGAALALFGIGELPVLTVAQAPTNLRRLVALARAMILDPDLLVLDDPAADFDPESADEVWAHLLDLARARGLAVLAAAAVPPRDRAIRRLDLGEDILPATRRFSAAQRRTAVLPALPAAHPDIIVRKPKT